MALYRCFFKNERGSVAGIEEIEAESDDHAKAQSLDLLKAKDGFHGIELWLVERLIHRHP